MLKSYIVKRTWNKKFQCIDVIVIRKRPKNEWIRYWFFYTRIIQSSFFYGNNNNPIFPYYGFNGLVFSLLMIYWNWQLSNIPTCLCFQYYSCFCSYNSIAFMSYSNIMIWVVSNTILIVFIQQQQKCLLFHEVLTLCFLLLQVRTFYD